MKTKPYLRKQYVVVRKLHEDSELVESLPMTEKQAVGFVLDFQRKGYHFADYRKIDKQ